MKENNQYADDLNLLVADEDNTETIHDMAKTTHDLNYWLTENKRIMETLTIKNPVSWSEQDWGG